MINHLAAGKAKTEHVKNCPLEELGASSAHEYWCIDNRNASDLGYPGDRRFEEMEAHKDE